MRRRPVDPMFLTPSKAPNYPRFVSEYAWLEEEISQCGDASPFEWWLKPNGISAEGLKHHGGLRSAKVQLQRDGTFYFSENGRRMLIIPVCEQTDQSGVFHLIDLIAVHPRMRRVYYRVGLPCVMLGGDVYREALNGGVYRTPPREATDVWNWLRDPDNAIYPIDEEARNEIGGLSRVLACNFDHAQSLYDRYQHQGRRPQIYLLFQP